MSRTSWVESSDLPFDAPVKVTDASKQGCLARTGGAEATLSENTAFKKLFRYGHQAPQLQVIWLDTDDGLHKRLCGGIEFPNAYVRPFDWYFPKLRETSNGADIIRQST